MSGKAGGLEVEGKIPREGVGLGGRGMQKRAPEILVGIVLSLYCVLVD